MSKPLNQPPRPVLTNEQQRQPGLGELSDFPATVSDSPAWLRLQRQGWIQIHPLVVLQAGHLDIWILWTVIQLIHDTVTIRVIFTVVTNAVTLKI